MWRAYQRRHTPIWVPGGGNKFYITRIYTTCFYDLNEILRYENFKTMTRDKRIYHAETLTSFSEARLRQGYSKVKRIYHAEALAKAEGQGFAQSSDWAPG